MLIGLLLSLFAAGNPHVLVLTISGLFYGAIFGALFGFAGHAFTGGRRDFASRSQIVAARYDVVAETEVAEEAKSLLIELGRREGRAGRPAATTGISRPAGAGAAAHGGGNGRRGVLGRSARLRQPPRRGRGGGRAARAAGVRPAVGVPAAGALANLHG
ncbi:hypothetical protein ACFY1B_47010 [Streptomyces mirabilis]|uniref:hypothetical protein n=1 Tax=Streptomyces mirabilis TaxID=68239 RepID=UPI0036A27335